MRHCDRPRELEEEEGGKDGRRKGRTEGEKEGRKEGGRKRGMGIKWFRGILKA